MPSRYQRYRRYRPFLCAGALPHSHRLHSSQSIQAKNFPNVKIEKPALLGHFPIPDRSLHPIKPLTNSPKHLQRSITNIKYLFLSGLDYDDRSAFLAIIIIEGLMRCLFILCLLSLFTHACRHRSYSDVSSSCEGLFGSAYQKCLKEGAGGPSLLQMNGWSLQVAAGSVGGELTGLIYNIKSKNDDTCLSGDGTSWVWQPCQTYAVSQQFHFDDRVDIKYSLKRDRNGAPIILDGTAFRIQTRESALRFLGSTECEGDMTPEKDGCIALDFSAQSFREKGEQALVCLSIDSTGNPLTTACSKAVYFLAMPNKNGDNLSLIPKNVYSSLVALVDKTTELDSVGLATETTVNTECDPIVEAIRGSACPTSADETASIPAIPPFLDFTQHFDANSGSCQSFRFLSRGTGNALTARCPDVKGLAVDQNDQKNSWVTIDACEGSSNSPTGQCFNDSAIKDFTDHIVETEKGLVVQVMRTTDTEKCVKVPRGRAGPLTFEKCKDAANDNSSTQFRMAKITSKPNGESIVQLRSMVNPDKCVDLTTMALVDCQNQTQKYVLDSSTNDLRAENDANQFYKFHHCSIATNHEQSGHYDCHYQTPAKIKRWAKLSFALGFLALAAIPLAFIGASVAIVDIAALTLSVPSYVFDGLVCASKDPLASASACMSLQIGIVADVALSDFGGKSFASAAMKKPAVQSLLKNNFSGAFSQSMIYTAKKLVKSRTWRPEFAASAFNASILQMIKAHKYGRAELSEIFRIAREQPGKLGCGLMSCNHPLMPFPRRAEIDSYIDLTLLKDLQSSKMEPAKKQAIEVLLSSKSTPEQITAAKAKL